MKFIAVLMTLCLISITNVSAQNTSAKNSKKEESATDQLNKSPRHLDWVTLKSGDRNIKCFIAYPEIKGKATSVIVIHEIFGLSDWVRTVCDGCDSKSHQVQNQATQKILELGSAPKTLSFQTWKTTCQTCRYCART